MKRRLVVVSAAAVALAVALAAMSAYLLARAALRDQVDDSLRQAVARLDAISQRAGALPLGGPVEVAPNPSGGLPLIRRFEVAAPAPDQAGVRAVAEGEREPFLRDAHIDGTHVRLYIARPAPGVAVPLVRSLEEVDRTLASLRLWLLLAGLAGVGLAAFGATRIAGSYARTLEALEESQLAQKRLVADASHELRTPLTSLRTNLEVLASEDSLDPDDRERLRSSLVAQLDDLGHLVGDLVDVARDEQRAAEPADVRLDEVVRGAVQRARRQRPGVTFELRAHATVVRGHGDRIDRAVANLLDNAGKWSERVEVEVAAGEVRVRDHGPGIEAEHLPHVFARFYRAPEARGTEGSGLGLAIVRQVAEAHGGSATAEAAPGGGTLMRLRLSGTS